MAGRKEPGIDNLPDFAVSSGPMLSRYSRGFKQRISRFFLVAVVIGIIVFCEIRKQSLSSLRLKPSIWAEQRSPRESQLPPQSQIQLEPKRKLAHEDKGNEGTHGRIVPEDGGEHPLREGFHHDPEQKKDHVLSSDVNTTIRPVVGKITISFGERDPVFDRAIQSHEHHNKMYGYPQFVLRERVLSGLWSKHAYIISILVQELGKPEDERLQWLMWIDRDTVLMNPNVPLEMFLPPPNMDHIHLLVTNDRHGLNNGAFLFRVNEWSLKYFSSTLAFGHYNPDVKLKYTEQSAMEEVLFREPWFNKSSTRVPQRWFNAFPPPAEKQKMRKWHGRPGQLLLHFASNRDGRRPERMNEWMDIADQATPQWTVPYNETSYPQQIAEFWTRLKKGDDVVSIIDVLENED